MVVDILNWTLFGYGDDISQFPSERKTLISKEAANDVTNRIRNIKAYFSRIQFGMPSIGTRCFVR